MARRRGDIFNELEIRETRRLVTIMFTIRFKAEAVNQGMEM